MHFDNGVFVCFCLVAGPNLQVGNGSNSINPFAGAMSQLAQLASSQRNQNGGDNAPLLFGMNIHFHHHSR